jgi:hypothetical protein
LLHLSSPPPVNFRCVMLPMSSSRCNWSSDDDTTTATTLGGGRSNDGSRWEVSDYANNPT